MTPFSAETPLPARRNLRPLLGIKYHTSERDVFGWTLIRVKLLSESPAKKNSRPSQKALIKNPPVSLLDSRENEAMFVQHSQCFPHAHAEAFSTHRLNLAVGYRNADKL